MASEYSDPEEAELDFALHPYKVGDLVDLKWAHGSPQQRWSGPFKVTSIDFASLKLDGVERWVHHSEVRRYLGPPPEEEEKKKSA